MNIIISPAKKMNVCNDDILPKSNPCLIDKTRVLYDILRNLSYEELQKLLECNDEIAEVNFYRYKDMNLSSNLSPAILTYDGIQYKYMAPNTLSTDQFGYMEKHLKILSGFYGILKPFDGVTSYRLEMQAKLKSDSFKNLYDFWGNKLYEELIKENRVILNLASKEYSKAIEKYLSDEDRFVTCIFGTLKDSKIKVKATEAKMARGLMTRFLCENFIEDLEGVKNFCDLGFTYSKEHSNDKEFVFLK